MGRGQREEKGTKGLKAWCVVGDFNSIRKVVERRNTCNDVDHGR